MTWTPYINPPAFNITLKRNVAFICPYPMLGFSVHRFQNEGCQVRWTWKIIFDVVLNNTNSKEIIYDYDKIHYHEKRQKSNYHDFHIKNKIHQIEIIDGSNINKRIENYTTPQNHNEARIIIEDPNSNYLTSPELSFWYSFDKELALIVLKKCPHAIELLDYSIVKDPAIINAFALTKTENNGENQYRIESYQINDMSTHNRMALSKMILRFYGDKNQIADSSTIQDMSSKETDDSSENLDIPW